jgi:hypothetical protein
LQDEIGSLEIGKRTDITVFDITHPPVNGWHRPVSSLVFSATGADAVLVNGQVVLRDRRPGFTDETAVLEEGRAIARTLLEKTSRRCWSWLGPLIGLCPTRAAVWFTIVWARRIAPRGFTRAVYHEPFNEPERRVVLGDVVAWLDARSVPQQLHTPTQGA